MAISERGRAQGTCCWDRAGKWPLDALGGISMASLGQYSTPELAPVGSHSGKPCCDGSETAESSLKFTASRNRTRKTRLVDGVIIDKEPDRAASMTVAPVGGTGGIRHDVLLIFDEVISGIGKTGAMIAALRLILRSEMAGKDLCGRAVRTGGLLRVRLHLLVGPGVVRVVDSPDSFQKLGGR